MMVSDVINQAAYAEKLPLQYVGTVQYLQAAAKAAAKLQWYLVAQTETSIIFQTPANYESAGHRVAVTIQQREATLQSQPVDTYYSEAAQDWKHVQALKQGITNILTEEELAHRNLHPMHREKYGALVPSKSYLVTPIIVYINALIFLAMVATGISPLHPTAQELYMWGGNLRPAVVHGDWWRLVSYMFLHGGAWHLLANTYALLYIGMFLEPLLGKFRFASAYLLSGICAGLLSIVMHNFSVGVGASGAIFGMYGVFLSMLTTSHIQKTMRKTMLRSILFFVVFNLFAGLQGNTDNAAHIGGLLSGLVIGYAYYSGIKNHVSIGRQITTTLIIAACIAVLLVWVLPILG